MAFVVNLLAAFIRNLATESYSLWKRYGPERSITMAAGLEKKPHGLRITKKYGPVCVFASFYQSSSPSRFLSELWALEFCKTCRKCATHCPSRAIPMANDYRGYNISNQSGVLKWYVDAKSVFIWAKNRMDCIICIRTCPFNKARDDPWCCSDGD